MAGVGELLFEKDRKKLLKLLEDPQLTQELCNKIVQDIDHIALAWIPEQFRTKEICEKCLKSSIPSYYTLVPEEFMDREMWMIVFEKDGNLILNGDIPEEMLDQEMYEIAVLKGCLKLKYVPHVYRNKEICFHVLKFNKDDYNGPRYVPTRIIHDRSLQLELVTTNFWFLSQMKDEDKTVDICRAAINQNYTATAYLPKNTEGFIDLVAELIEGDEYGFIFQELPKQYKTKDICMKTIALRGHMLSHIPSDMIDYGMCITACLNDPDARKYVPPHLMNRVYSEFARVYNNNPCGVDTTGSISSDDSSN